MPFIAYTAIRITTSNLGIIASFVGEEEWIKSKDEMTRLAIAYADGDPITFLLPDFTHHISCDHVTDSDTLFGQYYVAQATDAKYWITPKKK
jgi:hypothetical protein